MKIEKLICILNDIPRRKKVSSSSRYVIIACALDKKGKVLAMRTNDYSTTHPLQKHFAQLAGRPEAIYLHAEIATLIAAKKPVHTLLIARINVHGKPVPAKPCEICELAIKAFGVKEIIHT